jgi:hypothetical protein
MVHEHAAQEKEKRPDFQPKRATIVLRKDWLQRGKGSVADSISASALSGLSRAVGLGGAEALRRMAPL